MSPEEMFCEEDFYIVCYCHHDKVFKDYNILNINMYMYSKSIYCCCKYTDKYKKCGIMVNGSEIMFSITVS